MIRLLLQPVNFLILDEPTNHLDIRTKDVLKEAIKNFDGTAIIVSHDRDFLDGLVTKVYEFGGGKVKEHLGGIYEFLQSKEVESFAELEKKDSIKPSAASAPKNTTAVEEKAGALDYQAQKELRRKEQKLNKIIAECEQNISDLEASIKILEDRMSTPEGAADLSLIEKHANLSKQLEQAMEEWTEASEEKEQLYT